MLRETIPLYQEIISALASAVIIVEDGAVVYISPDACGILKIRDQDALMAMVEELSDWAPAPGDPAVSRTTTVSGTGGVCRLVNARLCRISRAGRNRIIISLEEKEPAEAAPDPDSPVTVNRQSEAALQAGEARMRLLMDSTFEAIVGLDGNGMCTFINRAGIELLGYDSADELIGRNMHDVYHHSDPDGSPIPAARCPQIIALKQGKALHGSDLVFWRRDGSSFPAAFRLQPFTPGDGSGGGVVSFLDISEQIETNRERKRLEEELRHSQKMEALGRLAGGIAHDFNNILGGIIGYGELLEMFEPKDSAEIKDKIGRILQAAYRAKDLISQVLAFSRRMTVEYDTVRLVPLIEETLALLRASLPATIVITTSFAAENDLIYADPTQIQQVLLNLGSNGADSMRGGGTLSFSLQVAAEAAGSDNGGCDVPGPWLLLEVQDTGCGIAPGIAEHMFEPYFTTKAAGQGAGLGLAQVYGIVRAHGGHIICRSKPGNGSVFQVYLPQQPWGADAAARICQMKTAAGSGRILYVDDEPNLVDVHREYLVRLGYEVVTAESGSRALELFGLSPDAFDLVITDETMPGLTGLELAVKIRGIRADMPVILCSGDSAVLEPSRVQAAGITDVLVKPVSLAVLARRIEEVSRRR